VATVVVTRMFSWTESLGSEPTPGGFATEVDGELIGQSLGEMGEIEVEAVPTVEFSNLLAQASWFGVSRGMAAVAVTDAIGAMLADVGLDTEDLTRANVQHSGGGCRTECGAEGPLDNAVAFHVLIEVAG